MTPSDQIPEGGERTLANDGRAEFRVWWIPQIPMEAFRRPVFSYAEGKRLEATLAMYDLFQLDHNVKPDFSNAGGTEWRHPVLTEGEWWELDEEEAEDYGWSAQ